MTARFVVIEVDLVGFFEPCVMSYNGPTTDLRRALERLSCRLPTRLPRLPRLPTGTQSVGKPQNCVTWAKAQTHCAQPCMWASEGPTNAIGPVTSYPLKSLVTIYTSH